MRKTTGSIAWPGSAQDAVHLLLLYMVKVLERLDIRFDSEPYEPVAIVRRILGGEDSEERRRALDYWWTVIDKTGIRNLESKEVPVARLAVCLLTPNVADTSTLGEQLSWFLEVLAFLGADVDKAIDVMEMHFSFP